MAGRKSAGNPKLEKNNITNPEELYCSHCNELHNAKDFYDSDSEFYKTTGKIPYCKPCIDEFYQNFLENFKKLEYINPERKSVERICMAFDLYYNDKIFDTAMKQYDKDNTSASVIACYIKAVKLYQYRDKNYNTTINDRFEKTKKETFLMSSYKEQETKDNEIIEKAKKFFGSGFESSDYLFLQEQYNDWITRHECQTKTQEELFKQICFTQLKLLKADRAGEDTKDLTKTYLELTSAAKLQPKQNSGETMADNQTFGTLIDKFENTRPLPEIDDELKDVDRIGKYINIFFYGHLAKMMGVKNVFCKAYEDFMKKYSVTKPEYENDDYDSEALFDAIFGGDLDSE